MDMVEKVGIAAWMSQYDIAPESDVERAMVRQMGRAAMGVLQEWQPIETAPKDGTLVLLWWPHWWSLPHPGYFKDNRWHSDKALSGGTDDDPNGPACWMSLPGPPKSAVERC